MEISNFTPRLVTIFGGSGFIGQYVVRLLAARGWRIRVAVRRPDLAGNVQPLGNVGQIQAVQANVRHPASVQAAIAGADAVVNLVGILQERGRQGFTAVQAEGARHVAEAARAAGVTRFVHLSALGADPASPSLYAQSKAAGEKAVFTALPSAVIVRPSVVFGPEDDFFNRFASMARFSPFLPLIGGGETKFQPVFVGDVAEVVARGVTGAVDGGKIYELGGPEVLSFRACLERMLKTIERRRLFLSLPFPAARLFASLTEWLPGAPLSSDQIALLERDTIVSEAAKAEGRTFAGLGLVPHSLESILPTYLYAYRPHGQYDRGRVL